jgi:hypothetical protein
MTITGKSSKSITKADLISDKSPAFGYKKVVFAHKATAGQTSIDLLNLTLPTEASSKGLVQPSAGDLAAANLQVFGKNLTLISSVSGILMPYVSYVVSGNTIQLTTAALANELFIGTIDPVAKSNSLVADTEFVCSTGTLAAGLQEINAGKSFKVNLNPTQQVGAVMVIIDGQVMLRNTGNATAVPSADGDYQEVPDSTGQKSSVIKMNAANGSDRAFVVVSTALSTVRPDGSIVDELERIQGMIDGMIPTLADLAGVAQGTFQIAPTSQQLKQFGDRVVDMERYKVVSTSQTLSAKGAQNIAVDTSAGVVSITLPASPSPGDRVMFMDAKRTFSTNKLSILRNGNSIAGVADDLDVTITGSWVELVFVTGYGWSIRQ